MLSKLWQNVVMTSAVEFFCLPCESHLRSISDAESHIAKPVHKKALDATPYVEGHEDNRIRKVSSGFYCEFCNILFTASSKIRLHASDPTHLNNQGTQLLKREGTSIIAFNNVAIPEKAWNGFQGNTCLVCIKDFASVDIHKSEKEHIIKLMQSKLEFGEDKSIYRKTEDGYQCLTCNEELLQAKFDDHFSSTAHKNKYIECIISTENRVDENHDKNGTIEVEESVTPKEVNKTAVKQEVKSPAAETKPTTIDSKNTSKGRYQDPYKVDKRFCEVLHADEYVCELNNRFCLLCEIDIPDSKTAHIASVHHQQMLMLHKNRLDKKKAELKHINESTNDTSVDSDDNNSMVDKIVESINGWSKDEIDVNFETLVASCKSCKQVLEFDYEVIKDHIAEHKDKDAPESMDFTEEPSSTTLFAKPVTTRRAEVPVKVELDSELIEFAKKNGLEVQDDIFLCKICGVHLMNSNVKTHVSSKGHNNRMRKQMNATPERSVVVFSQKVPMRDYIKDISQMETLAFLDFVINFKHCLHVLSFFMYTKQGHRIKCQACLVFLTLAEVDMHKVELEHMQKMETTPVLTAFEDEFIREVQPSILHCGYCNEAVDDKNIQNHLSSAQHKETKRSMQARLNSYLPQIRQRKRQEADFQTMFMQILAKAAMMQNN